MPREEDKTIHQIPGLGKVLEFVASFFEPSANMFKSGRGLSTEGDEAFIVDFDAGAGGTHTDRACSASNCE
jgi:hypothetical protein